MKQNIIILMFLFIVCETLSQEVINVVIEVNSEKSMIFINDEFVGNGKVTKEVRKGINVITIYERNRGWNSQVILDTVDVGNDKTNNNYSYAFHKRILIDSVPQNAKVFENEMLIGHTPFLIENSVRSLTMMKSGYRSFNNFKVNYEHTPIELNFIGNIEPEEFSETTFFKVLLGTAIALGATTAYLKIQADQKFDKFNETRNKKILNDVDQYDMYSGISLGLLQINIGYLIYRFVFD